MTQEEFIKYLHKHNVTPQGDLTNPPYELVASGEVIMTFESQEEVVARLDKEDAEQRDWEMRNGFADE